MPLKSALALYVALRAAVERLGLPYTEEEGGKLKLIASTDMIEPPLAHLRPSATQSAAPSASTAATACPVAAVRTTSAGGTELVIEAWVAPAKAVPAAAAAAAAADAGDEQAAAAPLHAVRFKRVRGDTFAFHVVYRGLREEMTSVNGWSDGKYRGDAVPGVGPLWRAQLRELLSLNTAARTA